MIPSNALEKRVGMGENLRNTVGNFERNYWCFVAFFIAIFHSRIAVEDKISNRSRRDGLFCIKMARIKKQWHVLLIYIQE